MCAVRSPRHLVVALVALALRRVHDLDEELLLQEGELGHTAPDRALLLPPVIESGRGSG